MNTTEDDVVIDATSIEPVGRADAPPLAEHQYRRFAEEVASVTGPEWDLPTDCELWTVRDLAGHVLGAMRAAASLREQMSQQREIARRAKRTGENPVDAMTAVQIERTAELSTDDLVAEMRRLVEPAAAGRKKTPAPMRKYVKFDVEMGRISERWTLGYLVDAILSRDILMHRIDLARAVGRQVDLSTPEDHRLIEDVVGEWVRRHGKPVDLTLTGPAGGRYRVTGDGAEQIEIDTVEFLRILSGRDDRDGLLGQQVPF